MFQERPYRQQRHSVWSIWWFVGLMGAGLTAWHLELIPFMSTPATVLLQSSETGAEADLALELGLSQSAPFQEHEQPGTFEAGDSRGVTERQFDTEPENSPPQQIQLAAFQSPEQNAEPVEQPANDFPVQTLNYQAELNPVPVRPLPPAQGLPPIQTAGYQQTLSSPAAVTAALESPAEMQRYDRTPPAAMPGTPAEPQAIPEQTVSPSIQADFVLSAKVEQDILRLRELSSQYWKQPELRAESNLELQRLAENIYFQPTTHYLPGYIVQPGDQLRLIAKNYQVSWQYLSFLNNTEPEKIRVGQTLKVIQGPFGAVVDLSDRTLTIHAHGYYVCSFPVATGKDDATPTGEFPVLNKVENPTYYGQDGVISADDPRNPLGEHWIDLGNSYGIHGTTDPNSIGQAVSKGCIRMHADNVAIVYDLLTLDSKVMIRP